MGLNLRNTLVIGISATALFDLSEADAIYREKIVQDKETAMKEYKDFMLKNENKYLEDGTGMPLVKALLNLNKYQKQGDKTLLVEVVVMSRNSPETGIQVFNNIRSRELPITRHAFTGGESVTDYLDAYDVDLFLTTNAGDAQRVRDGNACACALLKEPPSDLGKIPEGQVRIAFDGDAVIFDEKSEIVYKAEGLEKFYENENSKQNEPMGEGPYASLLRKISKLQDRLPFSVEYSPVRIAIVTARNAPAELRVIKTLRAWDVYVDAVFFLGGVEKSKILRAFKAHIFFDDQDTHLSETAQHTPSAKVPYASNSVLNENE